MRGGEILLLPDLADQRRILALYMRSASFEAMLRELLLQEDNFLDAYTGADIVTIVHMTVLHVFRRAAPDASDDSACPVPAQRRA